MPKKAKAKATAATTGQPVDAFAKFESETTQWNPYNARGLVYASSLAYNDSADSVSSTLSGWGFDAQRVTMISVSDLQAIVAGGKEIIVIAFRGTRPDQLMDWMVDFEILQSPFTKYFSAPDVGGVHAGFARLMARGWKQILAQVLRFQDSGQTLWITGHSLGGALAVLCTAAFTFSARMPVNGLYTFGQPRVGDIGFCTQCDSHFGDFMFRFVYNQDIVTRVPPRIVPHLPLPEFYGHSGQLRYFDANGNLHSDNAWWNSFLIETDVGFEGMGKLLSGPIADHDLKAYAANLEKYIASLPPG